MIKNFGPAPRRLLESWDMGYADPSQLSLQDLLQTSGNTLEFGTLDPMDLVVFVVHNAQALREQVA